MVLFPWLSVATLPAGEQGAWAHDASDLKPDPSVAFGVLDNGIRLRNNAQC